MLKFANICTSGYTKGSSLVLDFSFFRSANYIRKSARGHSRTSGRMFHAVGLILEASSCKQASNNNVILETHIHACLYLCISSPLSLDFIGVFLEVLYCFLFFRLSFISFENYLTTFSALHFRYSFEIHFCCMDLF